MFRNVVILALLSSGSAMAQNQKADPRAVDYCKARSGTFVEIADCLPDAHVSFLTIDAFDKLYPAPAQPLKTKCEELNKSDIVGKATCITEAIGKAIELKKSMPEGTSLGDAVFDAVTDETQKKKLDAAEKQAQKTFPGKTIWGMTMYHPYK